jgi:hypothetical protein
MDDSTMVRPRAFALDPHRRQTSRRDREHPETGGSGMNAEEFAETIRSMIADLPSHSFKRRQALRASLRKVEEWIPKNKNMESNHAPDRLFGPLDPGA